jgi:hypothetical protein
LLDPNNKISEYDESVLFEEKTEILSDNIRTPDADESKEKFYQMIKQQKYELITGKLQEFWKMPPEQRQRQNKLFNEIFSVCQKFFIEEFGEEETNDH